MKGQVLNFALEGAQHFSYIKGHFYEKNVHFVYSKSTGPNFIKLLIPLDKFLRKQEMSRAPATTMQTYFKLSW